MMTFRKALVCAWVGVLSVTAGFSPSLQASQTPEPHPSIFIRYQFDVQEIVGMLKAAEGKPLDPKSVPARWLDEMGWRRWVKQFETKPFKLSAKMEQQLQAQELFLRDTYSYQVGDVVWVPAEAGEAPYGHAQSRVNPRGQIARIIRGEKETYFIVQVGVDNGAQGGMHIVDGKFYDGRTGKVLAYNPDTFTIDMKNYVYSLSEIERYNAPFRSLSVGSDTGARVDYTQDAKWLAKLDAFKDQAVKSKWEVDFTKSPEEIYKAQRKLITKIFHHFKMKREAPGGHPLLGDMAAGGGGCFTQACVLSHAVHAVGEPYGIRAMNINGSTINPSGGHGFVRITIRGPQEVHVFDMVKDEATGKVSFQGLEIKSHSINYISDPGWADFGTTPDKFAMTPIEDAINPKPIDANRAIHDLYQGKSFEEVVVKYGNKGPMVGNRPELKGELFDGSRMVEFLAPKGQIAEAAELERALAAELGAMVDEAKAVKGRVQAAKTGNLRDLKTRILSDVVEARMARLKVPGLSGDGLRVLLTEYLFRAVR